MAGRLQNIVRPSRRVPIEYVEHNPDFAITLHEEYSVSKNVWDTTVPLKPVETAGGGKIVQDFFGLHDTKSAEQAPITGWATGTRAQNFLDDTERLRMNFGKAFSEGVQNFV